MTINSWNSNVPVELSKGGTNATSMATNTGIVKYDGTRLVTSSSATLDASNMYTNTAQPFFSAWLSATALNVTGDGTTFSLVCDTVDNNVGAAYSGVTGIFTAPINGVYLFSSQVYIAGGANLNIARINFVTTARTYTYQNARPASTADFSFNYSKLIYLTAAQTCYPTVYATGGGKTSDINGGSRETTFQGVLLT